MENKDDSMESYEKIYKDTDEILGNPLYILGGLAGRDKKITYEGLNKLREYAEKFLGCKNRGVLRTILIVLKPYKNNHIIKPTADKLADELRAGSTSGII